MDYEAFKALLPTGEQQLTADTRDFLADLMSDCSDNEGKEAEEQQSSQNLHCLHSPPRLRVVAANNRACF